MVKPCDFFQKLRHNLLCFPFIDALNEFRPDATLKINSEKVFLLLLKYSPYS